MQPVRAAPSGGALYPIELYAIVSAVDELTKGIYLYSVPRHALQLISEGDFASELAKATSFPEVFSSVSVTFVLTALFGRTTFKYGERGYRFALLEAGHIAQNILLAATAQKLGAVAVGGFIDDEINDLLDIDGVEEAAVYLVAAGRPRRQSYGQPDNLGQSVVDELISMLWTPKSTSNDDNGVDGSVNQ
jgi:SagB-type dehydrogenase family enzyme